MSNVINNRSTWMLAALLSDVTDENKPYEWDTGAPEGNELW